MSKTYDLIAGSLTELIEDLEATDGKNLKRESVSLNIIPFENRLHIENRSDKNFEPMKERRSSFGQRR